MALYYHLPVYKTSYDLLLAIFQLTKNFSREYKYSIGQDLKKIATEMILNIYRANSVMAKRGEMTEKGCGSPRIIDFSLRFALRGSAPFEMTKRGGKKSMNKTMKKEYTFYVYIMSNYERTTIYVGFTNNLIRRVIEHQKGFGSEFTKKYKLKYLVYYELYQYVYDAINREKEIKKWRREKKMNLIKTTNPELKDLSVKLFNDCGITDNEVKEITRELKERYGKASPSVISTERRNL